MNKFIKWFKPHEDHTWSLGLLVRVQYNLYKQKKNSQVQIHECKENWSQRGQGFKIKYFNTHE